MSLFQRDFLAGTVSLKGNKKLSKRHLELIPKQYRLFDRYLNESRPSLKQKGLKTDAFILGKLGTPITVDDVNYIIETAKPLFPDRNLNPKTIRASVIASWMNEKKIGKVNIACFQSGYFSRCEGLVNEKGDQYLIFEF